MPAADPVTTLPRTRTAVVAESAGKLVIKHDLPMPPLAPDSVIVKTAAVAINPSDAKFLDYSPAPGAVHGTDYSGTIVALGADAQKLRDLSVGDRVAGMVHGMNKLVPEVGAFGEYIVATVHTLLKIPDNMSFEVAATLGLAVGTATFGLFSQLRVPATLEQLRTVAVDESTHDFVLVAGGSTATGARAIQLLKLYVFHNTYFRVYFIHDLITDNDSPVLGSVPSQPLHLPNSIWSSASALRRCLTITARPALPTSVNTRATSWRMLSTA